MGVAPSHSISSSRGRDDIGVTVIHYRIQPSGALQHHPRGVVFSGPFCAFYRDVRCNRRHSHQFGLHSFHQRFPLEVNGGGNPFGHRRATIHGLEPMKKQEIEDDEDDKDSLLVPQADACSVCLRNPPKEPVACSHCKKVIACRGCLHTWFVTINSEPSSAESSSVDFGSCLLCRAKWTKIKREPGSNNFTML